MADMTPQPNPPTIRSLAHGLGEVHTCVEEGKTATAKAFADAAQKMQALTLFVDTYEPWLKSIVEWLERGGRTWRWWMRWWRWALTGMGGALLILLVTSAYTAIQTAFFPPASVASVDARTADRYTAADAARDRAAQDARDAQILKALQDVQQTTQADHQTLVGADHAANPRAHR